MALNITDADAYISVNCILVEDWLGSDEARKTRLLNAASRTLTSKYPTYTIPDTAVYEFANILSVKFNDTNVQAQNGVQSFTISGVATFSFDIGSVEKNLEKMVSQAVLDLIGAENGVKLRLRRIGRSCV